MRVLHAIAGGEVGGAEAFFVRLVRALAGAGIEQFVVMRPNPARAAGLAAAGVPAAEARFGGAFDLATAGAIARAGEAFRPDVMLAWMSRAARFAARARRRAPPVLAARLGGYYKLKYYQGCDHLIGNTPDIVGWIVGQGWPKDRVHFLPNFVDDAALPPIARAAVGTPADAPVILALGRLHRNKGFDVLLHALPYVPGAVLWIAGEGPEREALMTLADELRIADRVRFLGWRDDVAALLAAADLLCCPSRHEPLGNVVIEAWAHRRPVVAAAAAGPAWLVAAEETGLLAPVDDPSALAAALRRLTGDPALAARLSAAGRRAYEDRFAEAAVVARYRDFFERIAA
ncbi:MAG: glycosyltransferase [Rhodospirillales bacterium]